MYIKKFIKVASNEIVLLLIYFGAFILLGYILGMFKGRITTEVFLDIVVGALILVFLKKTLFTPIAPEWEENSKEWIKPTVHSFC